MIKIKIEASGSVSYVEVSSTNSGFIVNIGDNSELGMSIYLSPNELKELHKAIGIMMKDDN